MKRNSTLKELITGIMVLGIVFQLALVLFFRQHFYHAIGLWVGILLSVGLAIHMQYSIEDGLDLRGEDGVKHMQKAAVLRMVVSCVVVAVVLYYEWGNPLTLLIGIMSLKMAAYLQPITHRIFEKTKKGG